MTYPAIVETEKMLIDSIPIKEVKKGEKGLIKMVRKNRWHSENRKACIKHLS